MAHRRTFVYDPASLERGAGSRGYDGDSSDDGYQSPHGYRKRMIDVAREAMETQAPLPLTPMQALMEAPPNAEPRMSAAETVDDFEPLHKAMDALTDRERWVVEAVFWRGLSLRQLATELAMSKTQVSRIRDVALRKVEATLGAVDMGGRVEMILS